jgi:hypothetical protein
MKNKFCQAPLVGKIWYKYKEQYLKIEFNSVKKAPIGLKESVGAMHFQKIADTGTPDSFASWIY